MSLNPPRSCLPGATSPTSARENPRPKVSCLPLQRSPEPFVAAPQNVLSKTEARDCYEYLTDSRPIPINLSHESHPRETAPTSPLRDHLTPSP